MSGAEEKDGSNEGRASCHGTDLISSVRPVIKAAFVFVRIPMFLAECASAAAVETEQTDFLFTRDAAARSQLLACRLLCILRILRHHSCPTCFACLRGSLLAIDNCCLFLCSCCGTVSYHLTFLCPLCRRTVRRTFRLIVNSRGRI